jgi:hypothetical protein
VYLSSAEKKEGVGGSPQVSLDLCTGIGCHVVVATSPSAEYHGLRTGFSRVPRRERTGEFSNCPRGLLQSLLGLLHKSYSDSAPFQEALGVLRVTHKISAQLGDRQVWVSDIQALEPFLFNFSALIAFAWAGHK